MNVGGLFPLARFWCQLFLFLRQFPCQAVFLSKMSLITFFFAFLFPLIKHLLFYRVNFNRNTSHFTSLLLSHSFSVSHLPAGFVMVPSNAVQTFRQHFKQVATDGKMRFHGLLLCKLKVSVDEIMLKKIKPMAFVSFVNNSTSHLLSNCFYQLQHQIFPFCHIYGSINV